MRSPLLQDLHHKIIIITLKKSNWTKASPYNTTKNGIEPIHRLSTMFIIYFHRV